MGAGRRAIRCHDVPLGCPPRSRIAGLGGSRPGCSFLYHWPAHQCLPRIGHRHAAVGTDPRQCPRPVRGSSLDGLPNRLGELGGCSQECFRFCGLDRVSAERCNCCCARKLRCTAVDPFRGLTSRCLHRSSVVFLCFLHSSFSVAAWWQVLAPWIARAISILSSFSLARWMTCGTPSLAMFTLASSEFHVEASSRSSD